MKKSAINIISEFECNEKNKLSKLTIDLVRIPEDIKVYYFDLFNALNKKSRNEKIIYLFENYFLSSENREVIELLGCFYCEALFGKRKLRQLSTFLKMDYDIEVSEDWRESLRINSNVLKMRKSGVYILVFLLIFLGVIYYLVSG